MYHSTSASGHAPPSQALQACIKEALAEGPGIGRRWVQGVLAELRLQEADARSYRDKTDIVAASRELAQCAQAFERQWVDQWQKSIQDALKGQASASSATGTRSLSHLRFDELELMDDDQVQATVATARVQQEVQTISDHALSDLSARISRAQGSIVVRADQNPLRPEVVIQALSRTLETLCAQVQVRSLLLKYGARPLSVELDVLYRHLGRLLDQHGVAPAEYTVVQTTTGRRIGGGASFSPSAGRPGRELYDPIDRERLFADKVEAVVTEAQPSAMLTLDHLHKLMMSGDTPAEAPRDAAPVSREEVKPSPVPSFSQASADEADVPLPSLYTGPERRKRLRGALPPAEALANAQAQGLAELAQEVVGMMLDGIARDERLLPPVREALRSLRPVFLRIAKEKPRFFADKHNSARRLLDELTERSLAFQSVHGEGFDVYLSSLQKVVELLLQAEGPASLLFDKALAALGPVAGDLGSEDQRLAQEKAMASLVQAERRFMLADKLAQEFRARKDFANAPEVMRRFLVGPWAQVIAFAHQAHAVAPAGGRMPAEQRYQGLVSDLLWSCRPERAGRNRSRLVRVIPALLRTLREGLQSIDYPADTSSVFFAQLMALHELSLKAGEESSVAATDAADIEDTVEQSANAAPAVSSAPAAPWLNAREAQESSFMSQEDADPKPTDFADTLPVPPPDPGSGAEASASAFVPDLSAGAWIELEHAPDDWQRARLRWASPHGTMYLFTRADGKSISMTRRSFESLWVRQRVRLVAAHSVVDDALSNVMDAAVRNSVVPRRP